MSQSYKKCYAARRLLATVLALSLVLGFVPGGLVTTARAAATELTLVSGTDVTLANGGDYVLTNKDDVSNVQINVPSGVTATLTVPTMAAGEQFRIINHGGAKSPIDIQSGGHLKLVINGSVYLYGSQGKPGEKNLASLSVNPVSLGGAGGFAAIHVPVGAEVTLSGAGYVHLSGGDAGYGGDNIMVSAGGRNDGSGGGGGAGAGIGGNGGAGGVGGTVGWPTPGAAGEAAGTVNILGTLDGGIYGGKGGSGGTASKAITAGGSGGGGYPGAGIGGGGGGGGGGCDGTGGGGFSGGCGENANGYQRHDGQAGVIGLGASGKFDVPGGGGYFQENTTDLVTAAGAVAGKIGGGAASYPMGASSLNSSAGGPGGAGGTVTHWETATLIVRNGVYKTTGEPQYKVDQTPIYAQLGFALTSIRASALKNITGRTAEAVTAELEAAGITKTISTTAYGLGIGSGAGYTEAANGTYKLLTAPAKPTLALATNNASGELVATWTAPGDGGMPITGYTLQLGTETSIELAVGATTHTFTGLTNGTACGVKLTAKNAVGSTVSDAVTATPRTVPGAPTNIAATPKLTADGKAMTTVSWTIPATNGAEITHYEVSRTDGRVKSAAKVQEFAVADVTIDGTTASVDFEGLLHGLTYTFSVRAKNAAGYGSLGTAGGETDVPKKNVTITPPAAGTYTYTGLTQGPSLANMADGAETVNLLNTYTGVGGYNSTILPTAAGDYTLTISIANSSKNNYAATPATVDFTIGKAELSWDVGTTSASKDYDGLMSAAAVSGVPTVSGAQNSESITAEIKPDTSVTLTGTADVGTDKGYAITSDMLALTGVTLANYTLKSETKTLNNGVIRAVPMPGTPVITSLMDTFAAGDTMQMGWGDIPALAQTGATIQWKSGTDDVGTGAATYLLTRRDVGEVITVVITPNGNYTGTATSSATTAIGKGTIGGSVLIVDDNGGIAVVGDTFSADLTHITPQEAQGSTYGYSWKNAAGAEVGTAATYTSTEATTLTLTVTVDAADTAYVGSLDSSPVRVVKTILTGIDPITGGTVWDEELTAGDVAPAGAEGEVTYIWRAGGVIIPGATGKTYTTTAEEIGKTITVEAVAKTDSALYTGSAVSAAFGPIVKKAGVAPAAPTVVGGPYYDKIVVTAEAGQEYLISDTDSAAANNWAAPSGAEHSFTGLSPDMTYFIFTRATENRTHFTSPASTGTSIKTKALTIPGTPETLAAAGDGRLVFTWSPPADTGGSPILSYTVQIAGDTPVVVTGATTHTFEGLSSGTSYKLTVLATNAQGDGAAAELTATTQSGSSDTYYTVKYEVGANGTLQGSASQSVVSGGKPTRVPTVTANEGFVFEGWTTDGGKTMVDPATVVIRKSTTFTAVYAKAEKPIEKPPLATLNKIDHVAYMIGDDAGLFRPESPITRAEAAMLFARLTVQKFDESKTYPTPFPDVKGDEWFGGAVGYMQELGVVTGYPDGNFYPNKPISRAEFTAMVSRFETLTTGMENKFSDVPQGHWAADYINFAGAKGWVIGYEDGTFRPENEIARAEVVTLVNRMLERVADKAHIAAHGDTLRQFSDVPSDYWAHDNVMEAANAHDYKHEDGERWTGLN